MGLGGLLQVSGVAMSEALDDYTQYPLLARMTPYNPGISLLVILLVKVSHCDVWKGEILIKIVVRDSSAHSSNCRVDVARCNGVNNNNFVSPKLVTYMK
jgi:hypothetical protein